MTRTMNERTHVDLFTGLGGFSLAARANGVRTIVQCECEEFLAQGLERAWGVPVWRDVRTLVKVCKSYALSVRGQRLVPISLAALRATQPTDVNGESAIGPEGENLIETTTDEGKAKCSTITVENALAAERLLLNFFVSITSTTTDKPNGQNTILHQSGKLPSNVDSQTTTKFCATTAITPAQSTEYAPINSPWLITAGVPCQPASRAGQQRGQSDNRWLWGEAIEVVDFVRPTWALFENPPGIDDVGLGGIIAQVAGFGYEVGVCRIPACSVNSPQDRDRFWIMAHRTEPRQEGGDAEGALGRPVGAAEQPESGTLADSQERTERPGLREGESGHGERQEAGRGRLGHVLGAWSDFAWVPLPGRDGTVEVRRYAVGLHNLAARIHTGIPRKFRSKLIAALGNAIVPQVAAEIIRAMIAAENR